MTVPDRPLERPGDDEAVARAELAELLRDSPITGLELLEQLTLYQRPQSLSHTLALADLYRRVLDVHGVVFDLGTRYGRNMVTFTGLRRIFEPYNYFRKIIGFDTFAGFPAASVTERDGPADAATEPGTFAVPPGYEDHLARLLRVQERQSPLAHIVRHEIRTGPVETELPAYLADNPETVVAFAYFDMDLYRPTKTAIDLILPHATRGTVLAFDQPTHATYPGETLALKEAVDLRRHRLRRLPYQPQPAYIVIE